MFVDALLRGRVSMQFSWEYVAVPAALLGLPLGIVIILGAAQMRSLRSYELAITSSILAMLPLTLGSFIGLPLGLWAFLVLRKPEVKAVFAARALLPAPPSSWKRLLLPWKRLGPTTPTGWALLLCALGVAGSFLPWVWLPWKEETRGPGWVSSRPVYLTGLHTPQGPVILALFCSTSLLVILGRLIPLVRGGSLGRVLRQGIKVLVGVAGMFIVLSSGILLFLMNSLYPGDVERPLAFLVLGVPLLAIPWVPRISGRALSLLLGGWSIVWLAGYFIAMPRGYFGYPPDTLRSGGHFQFVQAGAEQTLGPGPLVALALGLGLIILGYWHNNKVSRRGE